MINIKDISRKIIGDTLDLIFSIDPGLKLMFQEFKPSNDFMDRITENMSNHILTYIGERKIIPGKPEIIIVYPEAIYSSYTFLQSGQHKVRCHILREDIERDREIMEKLNVINQIKEKNNDPL